MSSSFERHQRLMRCWRGSAASTAVPHASSVPSESENEILARHHKFVMSHDDLAASQASWETRMAAKYYRRLFKEYALVDLSRYKEGKLGLRWRTQDEVFAAKGQFECGNITKTKPCAATSSLHSYELNFAYKEHGQQKQELVKVRVCSHCAGKLNYRRQHKRSSRNEESSSRSSSKKRKHRERNDGDKTSDESEEKAIRSEPSATASSEITGNERGIEESLVSEGEEGKASTTSGAEGAAEASSWAGEAPTAKCEGDEMDAYLSGLFL